MAQRTGSPYSFRDLCSPSSRNHLWNAIIAFLLIGGVAAGLTACGPSTKKLPGEGPYDIWIVEGRFFPEKLVVKQDDSVLWTNKDDKPYTIVSDGGLFKQVIEPGGTFSFTFHEHNNHRYHSLTNSKMKGLVFVEQNAETVCEECHR